MRDQNTALEALALEPEAVTRVLRKEPPQQGRSWPEVLHGVTHQSQNGTWSVDPGTSIVRFP